MSLFVEQLPMWLSFGFTLLGVAVSIRLAWLAFGGVLFSFTLILTAGALIFGLHHFLELADPGTHAVAEILEVGSAVVFLAAAVNMNYRLRKILSEE